MKGKTCYKVVSKTYWSAITTNHALLYGVGRHTLPKFGKIFVFSNLKDAKNFEAFSWGSEPRILKGKAPSLKKSEGACIWYMANNYKRWWAGETAFIHDSTPKGTRVVTSFYAEKEIEK